MGIRALEPQEEATLACPDVAPQHRPRGPHPLALFLQIAASATGGDPQRLEAVLAGVRTYQAHPYRRMLPVPPAMAQIGGCRLLDYGGDGPPVVFVPSLVNPPYVLDLASDNSLLRWLATQGLRPLLVDWGAAPAEAALSIDTYISERLVPLLATLGAPAAVVGYCLGGTMALAAAALTPVTRLALIAAPWHFAGYGDDRRAEIARFWQAATPTAAQLGLVPMELLQPAFWSLDPSLLADKFTKLHALNPNSPAAQAFVALEDWANDGPPLGLPAARQLFEDFFDADLPGRGDWRVAGALVDPSHASIPTLNLVSTTDRIVPSQAAPVAGHRVDIAAGHVGMIVGSRARSLLWEPLRDWLRG